MRERTTWNRDQIKEAANKAAASPDDMRPEHLSAQPSAEKYLIGGPSEFAEDVTPVNWKVEQSGGETKRDEIGMPEKLPGSMKEATELDEETLAKKANLCVKVARKMLPKNASEDVVEDQAFSLMHLPDAQLLETANRLQGVTANDDQDEDDDEDDDDQGQQSQQQQQKSAGQVPPEFLEQQQKMKDKAKDKGDDDKDDDKKEAAQQQQSQQQQKAQDDKESQEDDKESQDDQKEASGSTWASQAAACMQAGDQQGLQAAIQAGIQAQLQQQQGQQHQQQGQQDQMAQQQDQMAQQQGQQAQQQGQQAQQDQQMQAQQLQQAIQSQIQQAMQQMGAIPPSIGMQDQQTAMGDDMLLDQMLQQEPMDQGMDQGMQMAAGLDEIQLEGPAMDVGVEAEPVDEVLRNLFASNPEYQNAAEAQAITTGVPVAPQADLGSRTASTRTVGTRPTGGVSQLGGAAGGGATPAQGEVNKLTALWQTSPDVSNHF